MFATKQDDIMSVDLGEVTKSIDAFKNAAFGVLLVISLFAIFTGIGGTLCLCKPCVKQSLCCAIIYAVPLFVAWLGFLVVGCVVTGVSTQGLAEIQEFCDSGAGTKVEWISDAIKEIDTSVNLYASTYMCSNLCKCAQSGTQAWRDMDDATLAGHGRVKRVNLATDTGLQNSDGLTYLDFSDQVNGFTNFIDCNAKLQEDVDSQSNNADFEGVPNGGDAFDMAIKAITYFEGKYTCSGICNEGLFYYSLPLSDGPPTKHCLTFMKDEIGNRMTYLGVAGIVIGVLMLLIFLVQYCLWCRTKD